MDRARGQAVRKESKGKSDEQISPEAQTFNQHWFVADPGGSQKQVQLVVGKSSKGNLIKTWEVHVVINKQGDRQCIRPSLDGGYQMKGCRTQGGAYVLTKYLVGVGAPVILVIICVADQVRTDQVDRGGEWLSWSPGQRTTYVNGFITGYLQGSHRACDVADELFEVGKPHRLGDQRDSGDMPSARCLARMEEYSKARYTEASGPDFTAYTDVITEFYTKHPEYRGIPFLNLMKLLSDRNYKTADQLYQMALKEELRPVR